ncbi:hypothetical protein [Deinococcus sp.]|uniref:hypothetical protein n=1 Tax=Deinococcus sp. TaxID=47478 RepID=UPI003B5BD075
MKKALLPLLALSLSACAPTVMGSQPYSPVVADTAISPVKVSPGQTVYIQYVYPRSVLDIKKHFEALKINFDARNVSNNVLSPEAKAEWLKLDTSEVPSNWQVSLASASIKKQIDSTSTDRLFTNVEYFEQLIVVYKVSAPADAKSFERLNLHFKDGQTDVGEIPLFASTSTSGI